MTEEKAIKYAEADKEEVVEKKKESTALEVATYVIGVLTMALLISFVWGCTARADLRHVKDTEVVPLTEVADGDWYANCYRWNKEGGIDFACYDEDVWNAPCMMSFRLLENAPDEYGDQSTFMLEVREVCPSN